MTNLPKVIAKTKETVFGSHTERSVYYELLSKWGKKYNIYLSLPLANIFYVNPNQLNLSEKKTYFQSSIDYTFCSKKDTPMFSIEFDGLGRGYSRGDEYIARENTDTKDPFRKEKLEFKLRLAKSANYPFVIVSFEEITHLDQTEKLTILDGIIGQITKAKRFNELISEFLEEEHTILESLSDAELQEYIQDKVVGLEVDAEIESDPIAKNAGEYNQKLVGLGITSETHIPLTESGVPDADFPPHTLSDIKALEKRIDALKNASRWGEKVSIQTEKGTVSRSVWVNEYQGLGFSSISLALNIADYLTFKAAYELLSDGKSRR